MIFSLILSLIFTNPVHADPPTATLTPQDRQIQQECRAAVKSDNVDYNKCIADAGRKAEEQRQLEAQQLAGDTLRAIKERTSSAQEEIVVCKPSEALKVCQESSKRVALMNNPSIPRLVLDEELQNCRVSCNPSSSVILREYLGGCGESAKIQKEQMYLIMNNCGQGVATADDKSEVEKPVTTVVNSVKSFFGYGDKPQPTFTDQFKMMGLSAGYGAEESETTSFATSQKTHLSQGVDYVRIHDRSGNEVMRYQSVDGSMHDSFESAAARSQQAVTVTTLRDSNPEVTTAEGADRATSGLDEESSPTLATSPRPEPRPTAAPESSPQNPRATTPTPVSDTTESDTADNYPRANQPIYQQAGAPGAVLQNALSSPIGGANSFSSPVSVSDVGEVSRGGSGSSSSGGYGGGSGRSFKGSGRELSPVADNAVTPKSVGATPEVADISTAGTGRPSGGSFALGVTGFEGRRVAALSPASFGGSGITVPTSDSFFKTPGSNPTASRSRIIKADPNCRPTKTKPCAMKRISFASKGSGGGLNCDGNPQCILKLTGKIKPSVVLAFGENGTSARSARGRGVASIESGKKGNTFPVGVRRGGLEDIVQYMQNIGAAHMKLDHEGMLVTD